jgi:D-alanyl-D-alanine carboxypeptidase (penicillin-binding protein 5/6)
MKKIMVSILIIIVVLTMQVQVYADDEQEEIEDITEDIVNASTNVDNIPSINSRACIILDRDSKKVLFEKDAYTKRPMASTTKIMTAIIVLENANLTDTVEISRKSGGTGGSRLGLKYKDKITVNDLLYGLMLRSGNDAAVALAEYVGGSVDGFAQLMNKKAEELGLSNTHFVTPHGLDEQEHYTSAYELALITDYALNNEKFAKIVNTKTYQISINGVPKTLSNTNELLGNLNGVNGVKTGFTNGAGRCLVTSTTRNGHQIICVVLGADTKKIRTSDSIKLIEYAFANYTYINAKEKIQEEFKNWLEEKSKNITYNKSKTDEISYELEESNIIWIPILKNNEKDIEVTVEYNTNFEAPVNNGQIIGEIQLKLDEEILLSANIKLNQDVEKMTSSDYFTQILTKFMNYLLENFNEILYCNYT